VPTVTFTGTQLAVISTIHTLIDSVSNRWFSGYIDLTNMAANDTTEIKAYIKINSALILWFSRIYSGVQTKPLLFLPTLPSTLEYKVTLQQTAGTGRNYDYLFIEP
jgi:hypothetical protein